MSKVLNYLAILGTILIGAHLLGLIANTGTSTLLSWLINPSSFSTSGLFTDLTETLTLFGAAATTTVIIGLTISQRFDLALLVGMASLLFLAGWDILAVYNGLVEISPDFAVLIIAPIMLVYFLTVIEWWRGVG